MCACAFPIDVQAASIETLALILYIVFGVAGGVGEGRPHAIWLIGFDTFASHVRIEKIRSPKAHVSKDFGIQSIARASCKESVIGVIHIAPQARILAEGATGYHGSQHCLVVPASLA